MMSSIDRAAPEMYSRPWMRAMVGLMPHRAGHVVPQLDELVFDMFEPRVSSAAGIFITFIPFRKI